MHRKPRNSNWALRGASLLAIAALGFSVNLLAAPEAAGATTISTHNANSASAVPSTSSVGMGFKTVIDPTTHTVKIESPQGTIRSNGDGFAASRKSFEPTLSTSTDAGPAATRPNSVGSYQCVVDTQNNSNFRGYTPQVLSASGNDYQLRFQFNGYSVDNARFISGYWTFQTEQCFTGGGTSNNYWNQYYIGASTTEDHDGLIGDVWGTTVINNTVTTTLNFNVSVGPVSIGGSTTVNGGDVHGGQLGFDGNAVNYPYSSSLDGNRVDAFYLAPHDQATDGTPAFEGNNGQALWEQPENGGTTTTYNWASGRYLCSLPFSACGTFG